MRRYVHWRGIAQGTVQWPIIVNIFDVHMSVHHNIIPSYSQQDATFLDLFISKDALHVSGGSFAHHQEHNCANSFRYCQLILLLSWMRWNVVPSHPR
jgi:hypothetical protein